MNTDSKKPTGALPPPLLPNPSNGPRSNAAQPPAASSAGDGDTSSSQPMNHKTRRSKARTTFYKQQQAQQIDWHKQNTDKQRQQQQQHHPGLQPRNYSSNNATSSVPARPQQHPTQSARHVQFKPNYKQPAGKQQSGPPPVAIKTLTPRQQQPNNVQKPPTQSAPANKQPPTNAPKNTAKPPPPNPIQLTNIAKNPAPVQKQTPPPNATTQKPQQGAVLATNKQQQQQQHQRNQPRPKFQKRADYRQKPPGSEPCDMLAVDIQKFLSVCDARMSPSQLIRQLIDVMQRPDDITWRMLDAVRHDLAHVLDTRFAATYGQGACQSHPFGSAISTLSFRDSDFDILIHLPDCTIDNERRKVPTFTLATLINGLARLMRSQQTFTAIYAITGARVPIIKSVHRSTGTACDFSFTQNFFSVQNTFVVRRLANSDPRLKPLTMLLKFWFRAHGYLGTGKFTSYCMFQMIVFYLQRHAQPILPPLRWFQTTVPAHLVEGWNVAFDFERPLPVTLNTETPIQLMFGFFRFYQALPLADIVLCTLTAQYHRRDRFEKDAAQLDGQELYVLGRAADCDPLHIKRALCVQDPFTLNINVGTCAQITFSAFVQHLRMMQYDSMLRDAGRSSSAFHAHPTLMMAATLRRLYRREWSLQGKRRVRDQVAFYARPEECALVERRFAELLLPSRGGGGGSVGAATGANNPNAVHLLWKACVVFFVRDMFEKLCGAHLDELRSTSNAAGVNRKQKRMQKQHRKKQQNGAKVNNGEKEEQKDDIVAAPNSEQETERKDDEERDEELAVVQQQRTRTPTKRDATGAAVQETAECMADEDGDVENDNANDDNNGDNGDVVDADENDETDDVEEAADAKQNDHADDTEPSNANADASSTGSADPLATAYDMYIEHGDQFEEFDNTSVSESTTLRQEHELAAEILKFRTAAVLNDLSVRTQYMGCVYFELRMNCHSKNSVLCQFAHGQHNLKVVQTVSAWLAKRGPLYMRKYFEALDRDELKVPIGDDWLAMLAKMSKRRESA